MTCKHVCPRSLHVAESVLTASRAWLLRRWRCLAQLVTGGDGESLQWSRRHRSRTFYVGRLVCVRGRASIESLAANCARRGVAACGQDVLRVVFAAGVVFLTCPLATLLPCAILVHCAVQILIAYIRSETWPACHERAQNACLCCCEAADT